MSNTIFSYSKEQREYTNEFSNLLSLDESNIILEKKKTKENIEHKIKLYKEEIKKLESKLTLLSD